MNRIYTSYLERPFQTPFLIATNCRDIAQKLIIKYGNYISKVKKVDKNCKMISVLKNEDHYTITTLQSLTETDQPIEYVGQYISKNTEFDDKIFALHGAAVEWKGQANLFLAPTTSGKTTLTAYMTNKGCGYLTDDCVLIDRLNFNVYPYSTPIRLREGGYNLLRKVSPISEDIYVLSESPLLRRFTYTPAFCINHPILLNKIYFIQRNENNNKILPMSNVEKIESLLKAPIVEYPLSIEYLKFVSQLAQKECFRLFYKDMDYVKDVVQS